MRIISQDGTMDVPYDYFSLSMSSGKYKDVEVAYIYCQNSSSPIGTKLAEYSAKEKAVKAMEMMRKAYTGSVAIFQNVEPTNEVVKALKRQDTEIVYAELDNQPSEIKLENHQNFYFQFPKDEEVKA